MAIEIVNAVMRRGPRSSKAVRLVFLALAEAADEYGFCYPSVETLAWAALCDERTVGRAVQELERNGYLAVRRDAMRGKGSAYFVNMTMLEISLRPSGSCTRKGDGGPKNTMHLQLERAAQIRFASGRKPPTGEQDKARFASGDTSPIGEQFRAGFASGDTLPIGEQFKAGLASGTNTPIGKQICTDEDQRSPDILNKVTGHFERTHRTFQTSPLSINRKEPPRNRNTPLPLPLSLAVEAVRNQVQVLPDDAKSESEGPATASATATAGRGNVVRMELQQRRDKREAGRWRVATERRTDTGVASASARVMRACGFTNQALLRQIVTAMTAHLAANRSAEAMTTEHEMVRAWEIVSGSCDLMRFAVSPKFFFSDGRWSSRAMWPWDQQKIAQCRRAGVGM